MRKVCLAALIAAVSLSTYTRADEIIFKNGDKLTGKIGVLDGGKLTIKTAVAGEVKVDMKDVQTFSSDTPIDLKLADGTVLHQPVVQGKPGTVDLAAGGNVAPQAISLEAVKKINEPPIHWIGTLTVGGFLSRGNTNSEVLNAGANFTRRSEFDRITFDGNYNYSKAKDPATGVKSTTSDNWNTEAKYDYFINPKLYAYADVKVAKDRIAFLDLRFAPGVGLGYQWYESPDFNFRTEGGVGYFYERFSNDGTNQNGSLRLAYHVDKKLGDKVKIYHDLEYYPKFDGTADFFVTTDAGIRLTLTKSMFTEFKAQLDHNNRPAPGRQKDDTRYLVNVGWTLE